MAGKWNKSLFKLRKEILKFEIKNNFCFMLACGLRNKMIDKPEIWVSKKEEEKKNLS